MTLINNCKFSFLSVFVGGACLLHKTSGEGTGGGLKIQPAPHQAGVFSGAAIALSSPFLSSPLWVSTALEFPRAGVCVLHSGLCHCPRSSGGSQSLASPLLWMWEMTRAHSLRLWAGELFKSRDARGPTILLAPYNREGSQTDTVPGIRLIFILLLCK